MRPTLIDNLLDLATMLVRIGTSRPSCQVLGPSDLSKSGSYVTLREVLRARWPYTRRI